MAIDAKERRSQLRFRVGVEFVAARDTVQGGVLAIMLDVSMVYLVLALIPEGKSTATTNLNVAYFKPAFPGAYTGEAQIERLGRTTIFARARLAPEDGDPVASAVAVFSVFDRAGGGGR